MPWQTRGTMSMKEEFIFRAINKTETISQLCKEFGISRTIAYKWLKRYQEEGVIGLKDRSRRPLRCTTHIMPSQTELILESKDRFPAWGAKKLRQLLINEGKENIPSLSTFNRVLSRYDKNDREDKKQPAFIRFEREKPNELWQMDFKGHFKTIEGKCYPLTVLDDHSRFALCLKACQAENERSVRLALEKTFREFGLPEAMTMDNGSPWKGSPPFRLSKLTVWLMRLGIKVSHSRPYHPQTQGKDERFHRSFKEEVLKYYQFKDLKDAQKQFDEWREIYNYIRPHEGIGLLRPIDRYLPSSRHFLEKIPPIEYLSDDQVRKVALWGRISFEGKEYFVGEHLVGEYVALRQRTKSKWDIYFCNTRIGGFKT